MPGPGTNFVEWPVSSGTRPTFRAPLINDSGYVILTQKVMLQTGTSPVSAALYVPAFGAQLIDIIADTTTAWNASATLSVGVAVSDTSYASVVVTSAGRVRPSFTGAQLANMQNVQSNGAIVASVAAPASTVGATAVTVLYSPQPLLRILSASGGGPPLPPGVGFVDNFGLLVFPPNYNPGWPLEPTGLPAGSMWNNFGIPSVVPGVSHDPTRAPLVFGTATIAQVFAGGGASLLDGPGPTDSGQLWNDSGIIGIS